MRLSVPLIIASLAVLGAFLVWFLHRSWKDEAQALDREANLLLVSAVRNIEGDIFDRFVFRRMQDDLPSDLPFKAPKGDSTRVIAIFKAQSDLKILDSTWKQSDSGLRKTVRHLNLKVKDEAPETTGALSIIVNLEGQKKISDTSSCFKMDSSVLFKRLETAFRQQLEQSGLPFSFRLLQKKRDDDLPTEGAAAVYADMASGQRYVAELTGYQLYLLGRIAPQIAFSCFLFGLVSVAFWLIFRNLRQQQRLTDLKNDFIRNITHELKTPVSTVSVAVEALQNFGVMHDPARAQEYLDISRAELNRLSLLVDRVLRMSLFEKDVPDLKPEPLDLKLLVEEILSTMRLQFEKYQAKVQFHSAGSDFRMEGDRLHLSGVIYNLLDNALKYSRNTPQVELGLEQHHNHILLSVRDRGPGIPGPYRDKIFERFFRIPTGDVHNVKGHGLGLSYVAGVIRQHQGDIQVENREGGGAEFRVSLPVQP